MRFRPLLLQGQNPGREMPGVRGRHRWGVFAWGSMQRRASNAGAGFQVRAPLWLRSGKLWPSTEGSLLVSEVRERPRMLGDMDQLAYMDAQRQREQFQCKKLSPLDVLKAQIARIEAIGTPINAITYRHFEKALDAARR